MVRMEDKVIQAKRFDIFITLCY